MATTGRNAPCPCGSGNKYKHCCGALVSNKPKVDTYEVDPAAFAPKLDERLVALENAVQSGDVSVKATLGLRYLLAKDATFNPTRGVSLIEQSAEEGDAEGCYWAATLACSGFFKEQDWEEALNLLRKSASLGYSVAQDSLRILAAGPEGKIIDHDDWQQMRQDVDLALWFAPPVMTLVRETPRIHIIENFVPATVCDWMIAQVQGKLERAQIYDSNTGAGIEDERRSNSQCDLDAELSGVLTFVVRARISTLTTRPNQAMEIPKVLHYFPGETFKEHCDYLDPREPAYAAELAARGQRADTFLIYLNDEYEGGETCFTRIDVSHCGNKGDALLFANVDGNGEPDIDSMHAGLPPTSGEKWIFSQWIRDLPKH